jgi:hypothetical protein
MTTLKKVTGLIMMFLIFSGSVFAQASDKITDKEMTQFVSVMKQMQAINQESQQEMITEITDAGLEVPRFNDLYRAQQTPGEEMDATEEEMKSFESAMKGIDKVQVESQKKIDAEVEKSGLTTERYEEINMIVQNDPEMQQKIIEKMQEQ